MIAAAVVAGMLAAVWLLGAVGAAQATITIEMVPVGNAGNAGELSGEGAGGYGPDRICGAVSYTYNIGKYEVTAGQYTAFLNAVAQTDPYGLYDTNMWVHLYYGCKIQRSGSSGSYTYSVASDYVNRPVNYVSFGDAMRFANWLHNGQPTGAPGLATTEDGAYYLNGATTWAQIQAVSREADWRWAVTSEDEWYKAAYYNPATAAYYDYPTSTNTRPSNDLITPDGGNNANFRDPGCTIDIPYFRTEVGAFAASDSPYGTFDQGGNLLEWTEAIISTYSRAARGGSYLDTYTALQASSRFSGYENDFTGFRVSAVPEPATLLLLALGGLEILRRRRRIQVA